MEQENTFITNQHILLCLDVKTQNQDLDYIKQNFCGVVCNDLESFSKYPLKPNTLVYMCGDIEKNIVNWANLFVIKELSTNYTNDSTKYKVVSSDQVPINVHGVGVYFRNFFNKDKDYFSAIEGEHKFQNLTESNKPGQAFRTGIYLTKVQEEANNNELKFKLLRCSSNLNGPTDNFRKTDTEVVGSVNDVAKYFFTEKVELDHVLAQIYENKTMENESHNKVEKKAKIKKHSDKTKDMPRNGLMAFCTFYKNYFGDPNTLTKLRFELKDVVNDPNLKKKFDVVLLPNSVFIMSLNMNRLYTHEIVPSTLPIAKLPIRLGYVVRCSKTNAIYKDGQTYIVENGVRTKLERPNGVGVAKLKELYYKENVTADVIDYDKFYFSLNDGDYQKPLI